MPSTNVAIIISTMNRPDFIIRTLEYYAKVRSPHPIYIGDSGNHDNARKIMAVISKLKDVIAVHYQWFKPGYEPTGEILPFVKEKYAILTGDDDYEIPGTLTKAAEFLENNPDYAAAGGSGIAFRLKESGAYGELKSVKEYPNRSLEANTASQRLTEFVSTLYTITFTCVNRTDNFRQIWVFPQPTIYTWGELFQVCFCAVAGKVKLLDGLGVVRHIHDKQWQQLNMISWIIDKEFHSFYTLFHRHIADKIVELDNISQERAGEVVKDALLNYILVGTQREKRALSNTPHRLTFKLIRSKIGAKLPQLKAAYRRFIPDKKLQMHYEVQNPNSPYYNDFKNVSDSFTGKDLIK